MTETNKVLFYSTTQANYDNLTTKDESALYFVIDSGRVYKGSIDVTSNVSTSTTLPIKLYNNKILFVPESRFGSDTFKVYTGSSSNVPVEVFPGVLSSYTDLMDSDGDFTLIGSSTTLPGHRFVPNAQAVYDFVTQYFTKKNEEALDGYISGATWDPDNFKLTLEQTGKDDPIVVNIPKDMFVQDVEYVPEYKAYPEDDEEEPVPSIVFTISTEEGEGKKIIALPVRDFIVYVYVGKDSESIQTEVLNGNEIQSKLIVQQGFNHDTAELQNYPVILKDPETGEIGLAEGWSAREIRVTTHNDIIQGGGELGEVMIFSSNEDPTSDGYSTTGVSPSGYNIGKDNFKTDDTTGETIADGSILATEAGVINYVQESVQSALTWQVL